MIEKPNRWSQFALKELQDVADRLYGKQIPSSRWRLELLLNSAGKSMMDYVEAQQPSHVGK